MRQFISVRRFGWQLMLVFSGYWFLSCTPGKMANTPYQMELPAFGGHGQDSASVGKLPWAVFYNDTALSALIKTALEENLDARIALQRIEKAKAYLRFAKGTMVPTMAVGGSASVRRFGLYTMDGAGNSTTDILPGQIVPTNLPDYFTGFQANWEADVWGKLRNRKRAAYVRFLSTQEARNWLITNLVAEVANQYYLLLALDFELDIVIENAEIQKNALDVVIVQKETGASNELAVNQFRAQLLNTKALELEIRQSITETENAINILMGRPPQLVQRNRKDFSSAFPLQLSIGNIPAWLENRSDVKQAELELLASRFELKSARAMFYPSLFVNGAVGFQAFRTDLLLKNPQSLALLLTGNLFAPLLNRSQIRSEYYAATAAQVEAVYQYRKTVIVGYTELVNQLANYQRLLQITKYNQDEVQVLQVAVDNANELYRTGRATYLEVLLAQRNALEARIASIEVKRRQLECRVNIYKALGGGWR
jgi:outer membrane protein, multidrug efflux system